MSRHTWNTDRGATQGFYRDPENAWIFGVCAGIADRFNFRLGMVRIVALVSLVLFFWITLALYLGATLLIREKPLIYSGQRTEYEFWQRDGDYRRYS